VARLSQQLIRNVLCSYLGYVTLIIGFFLFPFVVRHVGAEVYGIWLLTWAAVGYFELLDFGIGQSVARFVAECRAREDAEGLSRVCSACLALYLPAGVVALAFAVALSPGFPDWFHVAPEHAELASTLVMLAGLRMAVSLPCRVFGGILSGLQRLDLGTYIAVGTAVVTALGTVIVLLLGQGILAVAYVTLGVGTLADAVTYLAVRRLVPELRLTRADCTSESLQEVLGFSSWIFANRVAIQVSYRTDALVIGLFLPKATVTVYQIGLRLADLIREVATKIPAAAFPAASHLSASADQGRLRDLVIRGTRYAMVVFAPLAGFCLVRAEALIACWMGSIQYSEAATVVRLLLVAGTAAVAQNVVAVTLQAVGEPRLPTFVGAFDATANLALSLLLVRPLGVPGVALGTAVPIVLSNLFVLVPVGCRRLGVPLRALVRDALLKPLLCATVCAAGLLLVPHVAFAGTWGGLLVEFVFYCVAYLALIAAVSRPSERAEDVALFRQTRGG